MRVRPLAFVAASAAVLTTLLMTTPASAGPTGSTGAANAGSFTGLRPVRVFDTRWLSPPTRSGPSSTTSFTAVDWSHNQVNVNRVAAVVINLTVINPTTGTFVTAFPQGTTRPNVSSVNVPAGMTRANLVTVPISPDGQVSLFNESGTVDYAVDLVGYYDNDGLSGSGLVPLSTPDRILDTRDPSKGGPFPVGPSGVVDVSVAVDSSQLWNVSSFLVSVTAVNAETWGYLSAWDGVAFGFGSSTLNFTAGDAVPNMAVVPYRSTTIDGVAYPTFSVGNFSEGTTHVIVDLLGAYGTTASGDLRYRPLTPTRIVDTRSGLGGAARMGPGATINGVGPGGPSDPVVAYAGNLTVVAPTMSTYLTMWAGGEEKPDTSNVNAKTGLTTASSALVPAEWNVFNAAGEADVLVDIAGRFVPNGTTGTAIQLPRTSVRFSSTRN